MAFLQMDIFSDSLARYTEAAVCVPEHKGG